MEDLWRLSTLLESGDVVTARTERKLKVNEDTVVRKPVTLSVQLERVELAAETLRLSGIITESTEDVPKGAHHTIALDANDTVTVHKEWLSWQLEKLQEKQGKTILLLVLDREEATFAALQREPEILSTIKGDVPKKGYDGGTPFWGEIGKQLAAYAERLQPAHIVVASPAFFKEYVMEHIPTELRSKTVTATVSASGPGALAELVRRPELKAVLAEERYGQETAVVDELMSAIRLDKACYGIEEVSMQLSAGALKDLLLTTRLLQKAREEEFYDRVASMLRLAEKMKTTVHVLDTTAGEQIDKLGGIAGVKRW